MHTHADIFAQEDDGDALSHAPPQPVDRKPVDLQVRPKVLCNSFFDKLTLSISSRVPLRLNNQRLALTLLLV